MGNNKAKRKIGEWIKESDVHGTAGGEMPDPAAQGKGETEDRIRDQIRDQIKDAFAGRPILIPEASGDLADRAFADQEAEDENNLNRARQKKGGRQ